MIRLRLLGEIELTREGGEALNELLSQPKRLALLAYLAAFEKPEFHSRETLFGLFWPELNTERARAALSQSLYVLRSLLGDHVLVSRGREQVAVDHEKVDCDTVRFDRAVRAADASAAVALYRGDFLDGFYPVNSTAWEDWQLGQRARLRKAAAASAWQCAAQAEEREEKAEAVHWAGRAVEWSDNEEPGFRKYLRLLDRLGDRAGAVQAFRRFEQRLQSQFGVDVAEDTLRLFESISADSARQAAPRHDRPVHDSPAPSVAPAPAPAHSRRPRRIGWVVAAVLAGLVLVTWTYRMVQTGRGEPGDGGGRITPSEQAQNPSPADPAYRQGRHLLSRGNVPSIQQARERFEQALEQDPDYAPAWSGLADAFMRLASTHALPREAAYPRAREAAERALDLDPDLAEAHTSLATVLTRYYWDSSGAERHFQRALELSPDDAAALSRYSSHLRNHGRFAEARVKAERAMAIDPLAFSSNFDTVVLDLVEGRNEAAERSLRNMIAVNPEDRMAHFMLARVLVQEGALEPALDILDGLGGDDGPLPFLTLRGYILGRMGREEAARAILGRVAGRPGLDSAFDQAVIHLGLASHDEALAALERAVAQRDERVRLLLVEPIFEPLRGEPGYSALLEHAGLGL